jgi:hypothetical protein
MEGQRPSGYVKYTRCGPLNLKRPVSTESAVAPPLLIIPDNTSGSPSLRIQPGEGVKIFNLCNNRISVFYSVYCLLQPPGPGGTGKADIIER